MALSLDELMGNIEISKTTKDPKDLNIVIMGASKTGKTTLYRDLINVMYNGDMTKGLLLRFEDGTKVINDIQAYPKNGIFEDVLDDDGDIVTTAFEQVDTLVKSLVLNKDQVPFETICVDVVDTMYEIFYDEALRRAIKFEKNRAFAKGEIPKEITSLNMAYGGFGEGDKACNKLIKKEFYQPLKSVGYKFVDISHVRLAKIKNKIEEQEYQEVTSTLPVKTFNIIKDDAEIVLFIITKDDGSGNEIIFRDNKFHKACSRLKYLPERIDLDAQLLYDTIKKALEKEAGIENGTAELTDDMKAIMKAIKKTTNEQKAKLIKVFKEEKIKAPSSKKNVISYTDEEIARVKELLNI